MIDSRWRVTYRPTMLRRQNIWGEMWQEPAQPWLAKKVGRGGVERRFKTLPEAHAHAMKMSRTVKVELPEVKQAFELSEIKPKITIHSDGVFSANGEVVMALHSTEYKAAGEYLIALHYAKERALNES